MKITATRVLIAGAAAYVGYWYYTQRMQGTPATPTTLVDAVKADAATIARPFFPATIVKGDEIGPGPTSAADDVATTRSYVSIEQPFYTNAPYPTQFPTGKGPVPATMTRTERTRWLGSN